MRSRSSGQHRGADAEVLLSQPCSRRAATLRWRDVRYASKTVGSAHGYPGGRSREREYITDQTGSGQPAAPCSVVPGHWRLAPERVPARGRRQAATG
jgi:hypothetical protein